jgi:hypothetical protein
LTMNEGTVGKWYKKEGESVEKGEPIVEVISEKTTCYSEASSSGIRRKVLAQAGVNVARALPTRPSERRNTRNSRASKRDRSTQKKSSNLNIVVQTLGKS